jgi:zinc transporter ZupT
VLGFFIPILYTTIISKGVGGAERMKEFSASFLYSFVNAFSAGIMLGVALFHLLVEGLEPLSEHYEYPVGMVMLVAGYLLGLLSEQLAIGISSHGHDRKASATVVDSHGHGHGTSISGTKHSHSDHEGGCVRDTEGLLAHSHSHSHVAESHSDVHISPDTVMPSGVTMINIDGVASVEASALQRPSVLSVAHLSTGHLDCHVDCPPEMHSLMGHVGPTRSLQHMHSHHPDLDATIFKDRKALIKAILMEFSIAVHSIIMGMALGITGDHSQLVILMIVYSIHQFFEGVGLGLSVSQSKLPPAVTVFFGSFFSINVPIGIIIGIFIAEAPEDSELAQGYMNCIAAGTLVYVSCNEMIAELFSHETKVPFCRLIGLVGGLILGIAVMAVLAIWA